MNNCENLNIIELVKELDKVNVFLEDIFSTLLSYYKKKSIYDKDKECEEKLKIFSKKSLEGKIYEIKKIIAEGNAKDILDKIRKQEEALRKVRIDQLESFSQREEELLNAWNNFKNWKSEQSKNLIKNFNLRFKKMSEK